MHLRTAIIDIGSNSGRLVIYEQTSRYSFHLINEQKSKVRIGEGAYEKGGELQPIGIERAYNTLEAFRETIKKYKVDAIHCVATSALRDAPNGKAFTAHIKETLGLELQVIDGNKEAWYGALAVANLLPVTSGISIDIGGGSSDMALIENGNIVATHSLNLGTVRLKELFFDNSCPLEDAKKFIDKELEKLPKVFKSKLAIGVGGTARALAKSIMKRNDYPFEKLHAYTFKVESEQKYFNKIISSSAKNLKKYPISSSRYDTIREGTLILQIILAHIGAKKVMTSGVGVREGVFLSTLLKKEESYQFPSHKNPSVESLLSRFKPMVNIEKKKKLKLHFALKLYKALEVDIPIGKKDYKRELMLALRLSSIGKTLTIHKSHLHAFYITQQELNYGFTHKQMLLIAMLLRNHGSKLLKMDTYEHYKTLLPPPEHFEWLSFIFSLTVYIHEASNDAYLEFTYTNQTLIIYADKSLYLAKEKIKSLQKPKAFAVIVVDGSSKPPKRKP